VQQRSIGSLTVSLVGLGCNNFGGRTDAEGSREVIRAALDAGITLLDTADVYSAGRSEELIGEAIGSRRDEVVIATKFGGSAPNGGSGCHPDHVRAACEDSLRRLGTDRIDLYQMHFVDPEVPIAETIGVLTELVQAGKVREIGHSNMTPTLIADAEQISRATGSARFVCSQEKWSLLDRDVEDAIVPAVTEHGLRLLPYYPLASGLLTGKYRKGADPDPGWRLGKMAPEQRASRLNDERLEKVERLEAFALERERTVLELAMSWLAAQPVVASVIAGATRPEQITTNVGSVGWTLDADDLAEIDRLLGADATGA
jgi:aryl-alcohol dehydrogenase-like predicted oxidoreductase